ncbi:MAG: LPS export ABC transporter permease LptG [Deltaproteobacteria bacterium]|nr:LPS export ABC transporter permease LptG [Deltaproteobacteria bacterium]MBW2138107.1 LPS export ABC transporter permease LptG [Deltaproteobacteria bacterium]
MKVLTRYLTGEYLKALLFCEGILFFIYLVIDFLQKVDNFIEAKTAKGLWALFFLYKTPLILVQMLPPAVLIAVIVMFSSMKKRNEVTALKASGINIFKAASPVIIGSLLLGGLLFLFSEIVVPLTTSQGNRIWMVEVEKRNPDLFYGSDQIWYKSSNAIYWVKHFDGQRGVMEGPSFYFFDDAFRLVRRLEGKRAVWEGGHWEILHGIVQEVKEGGGYELQRFERYQLEIPEIPETFTKGVKKPEEMSYWQLKKYAKRVKAEGYDNTRYLVDMHIKAAFPFIVFVMTLIGMAISLKQKGERTPLVVSVGVGICFLYMVIFGTARALGLAGILPPILAAWLSNVIFVFAGLYLIMHVDR